MPRCAGPEELIRRPSVTSGGWCSKLRRNKLVPKRSGGVVLLGSTAPVTSHTQESPTQPETSARRQETPRWIAAVLPAQAKMFTPGA